MTSVTPGVTLTVTATAAVWRGERVAQDGTPSSTVYSVVNCSQSYHTVQYYHGFK
jgi:hypothetical protein